MKDNFWHLPMIVRNSRILRDVFLDFNSNVLVHLRNHRLANLIQKIQLYPIARLLVRKSFAKAGHGIIETLLIV